MDIRITRTTTPKPRPDESDLGFGVRFTDHMFRADYSVDGGWHDARLVPYGSLGLDPAASVFHYGQAMFEGLKAFRVADGRICMFRPDANARRMHDGAPRLCMVAPPVSDMLAAFDTLVREDQDWVPSAPGTALYIRPTLVATEAFLGVRPATRLTYFIIASPVGSYFAGGGLKSVRIWIETSEVRAPRGGLGGVKAGANYAASLHAATSARRVGYDQVLWLDARDHQYVEEVGTMNFFAVIDGTLVTPPLSDSILAGITRDSLLTLAADLGIPTEVRPLGLDELIAAHRAGTLTEAFGAGTAAVVSPISELGLDGASLRLGDGTPGPVARGLYAELTDIQRGLKADRHGWLRVVA